MEPDMIIIPHTLLREGNTIRIPQPQGEDVLATVLGVDGVSIRMLVGDRTYISRGGFFIEKDDGSYLPYTQETKGEGTMMQ